MRRLTDLSALVLAKDRPGLACSLEKLRVSGFATEVHVGKRGDLFPAAAGKWSGDLLISYLSPWIVPEDLLDRARIAAVNFHTGPPEYPGIGCTNFAIYDGVRAYGVTAHRMEPRVDSGEIIAVRRFPVSPNASVHDLTLRCYGEIEVLFAEILERFLSAGELPATSERWTRKPYTRRELNDLCRLRSDMPQEEIARRIRATTYPGMPGASLEI